MFWPWFSIGSTVVYFLWMKGWVHPGASKSNAGQFICIYSECLSKFPRCWSVLIEYVHSQSAVCWNFSNILFSSWFTVPKPDHTALPPFCLNLNPNSRLKFRSLQWGRLWLHDRWVHQNFGSCGRDRIRGKSLAPNLLNSVDVFLAYINAGS